MDRVTDQGTVVAPCSANGSGSASRYRFELAGCTDDLSLRELLANTPMLGRIAVAFGREPNFFEAAAVEGPFRQVLVARDVHAARIVAMGSRSIRMRFVNGHPEPIGYLSALRIHPQHRSGTILARGYTFLRELHADQRTKLYLTTVAADNGTAQAALIPGRAGLPAYHFAGVYHTFMLPFRKPRVRKPRAGVSVRPATLIDLPAVIDFLNSVGSQRQFFPQYREEDFSPEEGTLPDLQAADLLLAYRDGRLAGSLGAWDQQRLRQIVVHGYTTCVRWTRPLYNLWAHWSSGLYLPNPGEPLPFRAAALSVVENNDPEVFDELLRETLVRKNPERCTCLLFGMHESDPLLPIVLAYRCRSYETHLYLVCWPDGEDMRRRLDGRAPYLELGSL